jgi:hypothetical protein
MQANHYYPKPLYPVFELIDSLRQTLSGITGTASNVTPKNKLTTDILKCHNKTKVN